MATFDPTFPHKSHEARGFKKRDCLCEAQNQRCCYCGIRFSDNVESDAYATIEHVVPIIAGGPPHWDNEVMACLLCNHARGAMYADSYFQHVQWKGRVKGARYARQRGAKIQSERAKKRNVANRNPREGTESALSAGLEQLAGQRSEPQDNRRAGSA